MLSVLMSVYEKDSPRLLEQSFQSLCDQVERADQVILVEDGSVNRELQGVIEAFREVLSIESVRVGENVGLARALNAGLARCKHDLVARLDSDDQALPDRFWRQVQFMIANPLVAACSGAIEEYDSANETVTVKVLPCQHESLVKYARRRCPLHHPAAMFRRSAVLSVGGYPEFRRAQDYALWSLLLVKGHRLANLPDVLVRMQSGSELLKRRNMEQLLWELKVFRYQYSIRFLRLSDLLVNVVVRIILRLSPLAAKRMFYAVLGNRSSTNKALS